MPSFGTITLSQTGRVARAAMRWSHPYEWRDTRTHDDFERFIDWIEDQRPCDVLIFGPLSGSSRGGALEPPDLDECRRWEKLLLRMSLISCMTIATIDGPCLRLGLQLALACDHRLATKRSSFQVLELKEGFLPGMNVLQLAKYVGIGRARRFVFTGDALSADEAESIGLIDETCEPARLEDAATRFIERLQPVQLVPMQLARRLLSESFSTASDAFIGSYLASQHRCLSLAVKSPDKKTG